MIGAFFKKLIRTKPSENECQSNLDRCLSMFDLTILGIGSTLGLGIYILAGQVARKEAGPAVTVAFLIAAVASLFAGLCYAEFGSRVPRAGSAYIYSYVTVGELTAFIIGWNLILEYAIGAASVARGYSEYLDSLLNNSMKIAFREAMPIDVTGLSPYPDWFACGITVLLTIILCVGVKESTRVNNVLTCLNIVVVIFVVVCGIYNADVHNWRITKEEIPAEVDGGDGGFMPFGASSMLAGAATCFYGFVGFDCIATAGEEVKNPQRAIPISLMISLLCIFLAYFGVSAALTLMIPYYAQNVDAPIPHAFEAIGWPVAKWIVSIGALAGLSTSLFGSMFPLPRILYAMASDGLIFRFLSNISVRFKTPMISTAVAGTLSAFMGTLFELSELVDMMSIGTLLAYTLVAIAVLILRYKPDEKPTVVQDEELVPEINCNSTLKLTNSSTSSFRSLTTIFFNLNRARNPTKQSFNIAISCIGTLVCCIIAFNALLVHTEYYWVQGHLSAVIPLAAIAACLAFLLLVIGLQPQTPGILTFKVPGVPLLPSLSMFVNIYLMMKLGLSTWIRFAVWMAVGFTVYFAYGIRQSSEELKLKGLQPNEQEPTPKEKEFKPSNNSSHNGVTNNQVTLLGKGEALPDKTPEDKTVHLKGYIKFDSGDVQVTEF